jgi:hypothetical protein
MIRKATAVSALILTAGSAQAGIVYHQPYSGLPQFYASQNDDPANLGAFATVFDDFTLAADATVSLVGFTGGYFGGSPSTITGFTVTFYGDAAGAPGAALVDFFLTGNAGESITDCAGFACSDYSIGVDFEASGGTRYWLSIVPDITVPPQWGWGGGTGGDSASVQDFLGNRLQLDVDMAFTLRDTAAVVPEPASWALMILGFGLVGAALRRGGTRGQPAIG